MRFPVTPDTVMAPSVRLQPLGEQIRRRHEALVCSTSIDSAIQVRAFHSMNGDLSCPYLKAVAYEPGERIRTG